MIIQTLPSGKILVDYGDPVEFQSPLWVLTQSPEEVVYSEVYQGQPIARVYLKESEWYLSTAYLAHWQPIQVFTKYGGFLLLLKLRKQCQ